VGFFINLLINLAVQVGLNLLSRLLEPKQKRGRPQPFEAPTASSGIPLGKGFGVFEVQPTVVLVHEPEIEQDEQDDIAITRYYVKLQLMLGWGPISVLYDIVSDERSIRTQRPGRKQSLQGGDPNIILPALPFDFDANPSAGVEFSINARQIYGGGTEEGGLQGLLMFYPGYTNQPVDPLIAEVLGDFASAYPWGAYARLGAESTRAEGLSATGGNQQGDRFYVSSNSPAPKPISFVLGAYPDALLGDGGKIGLNSNPAEVLYEIYTDRKWGGRKPTARFDIPQWITKAQYLKDHNQGISIPLDNPRSLDDTVEDILSHIDAGIVEDPTTGLLQLKLARDDYDVDDLLTINKSNTDNFRRGKPLSPRSLNDIQVRYRRFRGGVAGSIASEIVTRNLDWNFNARAYAEAAVAESSRAYLYRGAGENLEEGTVRAFADDVELTLGVDFIVNLERGTWLFFDTVLIAEGMELRIQYVANPTFVAFVDEVATSQNLANQRSVGRQQAESYDYTFFTDPINAQWKADRLRSTLSRSIDTFSWDGKRDQSGLTPWDVVKVLEPEWGITEPIAVRITKVSYGTRTAPKLTIEGVKDIWGEELLLRSINDGTESTIPKQAAPAMGIGCGTGGVGVARIELFPTDFIYAVEVWEADDEIGTNNILVATIAAGTDPMFYDGTVGKFYAARQISSYTTPGPFTGWITCSDVDEPPVDPTCVLPTYTYTVDDLTGIITLEITDPQSRVQLVEFRGRSGNGDFSVWEVITAPYCYSVALSATEISRIEWRVTYFACDGSTALFEDGYDFVPAGIPEEPPPEPEPIFDRELEVVLHAAGPTPIGVDEIQSPAFGELLPLTPWKATEVKTPITWATTCYIAASLVKADLPHGSYLVIRGQVPGEVGVWASLGADDTPRIPLDEASLIALDAEATILGVMPVCVRGDWATMREEFLGSPLHIRADLVGVTGAVLEEIIILRLSVWFRKSATIAPPVEPPETEEPPEDDPGSCDTPTTLDDFTYASVAALDAEWPVV
jgi:hypothetical protein